MKNIRLEELATWIHAEYKGQGNISGIKVDARLIEPGDVFVCLRGERVDGHDYARDALHKGASGLVVDHYLDIDIPQILVQDTLEALYDLAKVYRSKLDAFFIGVTGSNGKTSTKDMFKSILSLVEKTHVTFSNQNTEIGTCLNLFQMDYDTKYGVFEMGLDKVGEISAMANLVKPDIAMVMSIAPTHIVNFKDELHIAQEKLEIFKYTENSKCFYQGDFELLRSLDQGYRTFGFDQSNEYIASDVVMHNEGISFKVNGDDYECNLLGVHQASNAAGVIGVLETMGVDAMSIKEGLKHVSLTSLRTEILQHHESLILLDAYKSNPDSTTYAIDILETYDYDGKKAVILSDMVELGEHSLASHIKILEVLAASCVDTVVLMGLEFKKALAFVDLGEKTIISVDDYQALVPIALDLFARPYMILIKGSRSYALERLLKEDSL